VLGERPDYSGILSNYTRDMNARINAGMGAMEANRISNARAAINRLGVRDPNAALGQVGKYGLTLADLQAAADNPFSELRGIQRSADVGRAQLMGSTAGRGMFRSGMTVGGLQDIERQRATQEAQTSEDTLSALASASQQQQDWYRQQQDQAVQAANQMEAQLAQSYQPVSYTAVWNPGQGGYVANGMVYDETGRRIR
jgi:hypothetical protein